MSELLFEILEKNTSPTGHYYLTLNEYLDGSPLQELYEIHKENQDLYKELFDLKNWKSSESLTQAIKNNRYYCLRWYPRTTVTFYSVNVATYEELLLWVIQLLHEDKDYFESEIWKEYLDGRKD